MLILGQIRLIQVQTCPARLGKLFSQGPAGLEPYVGIEFKKTMKNKRGGGVICAPRAKDVIVPSIFFYKSLVSNWIYTQDGIVLETLKATNGPTADRTALEPVKFCLNLNQNSQYLIMSRQCSTLKNILARSPRTTETQLSKITKFNPLPLLPPILRIGNDFLIKFQVAKL